MIDDDIRCLADSIPLEDRYLQMAEEAAELSQALLKKVRIMRGNNPTPMSRGEADLNLIEELGDVILCAETLNLKPSQEVMRAKVQRWKERMDLVLPKQ